MAFDLRNCPPIPERSAHSFPTSLPGAPAALPSPYASAAPPSSPSLLPSVSAAAPREDFFRPPEGTLAPAPSFECPTRYASYPLVSGGLSRLPALALAEDLRALVAKDVRELAASPGLAPPSVSDRAQSFTGATYSEGGLPSLPAARPGLLPRLSSAAGSLKPGPSFGHTHRESRLSATGADQSVVVSGPFASVLPVSSQPPPCLRGPASFARQAWASPTETGGWAAAGPPVPQEWCGAEPMAAEAGDSPPLQTRDSFPHTASNLPTPSPSVPIAPLSVVTAPLSVAYSIPLPLEPRSVGVLIETGSCPVGDFQTFFSAPSFSHASSMTQPAAFSHASSMTQPAAFSHASSMTQPAAFSQPPPPLPWDAELECVALHLGQSTEALRDLMAQVLGSFDRRRRGRPPKLTRGGAGESEAEPSSARVLLSLLRDPMHQNANVEELRRLTRREKNKISAAVSRVRQARHTAELERRVSRLQLEHARLLRLERLARVPLERTGCEGGAGRGLILEHASELFAATWRPLRLTDCMAGGLVPSLPTPLLRHASV